MLAEAPEDSHAADSALALGRAWEAAGETEKALEAYDGREREVRRERTGAAGLAGLGQAAGDDWASRRWRAGEEQAGQARFAEAGELYERYLAIAGSGWVGDVDGADGFGAGRAGLEVAGRGTWRGREQVFERLLKEYPESARAADARVVLAETAHQTG